jgi:hypothetical protein
LTSKWWRAKRLLISAFVLAHTAAVAIWNMPTCPIRERLVPTLAYYMFPLGLWQNWTMFAPDPVQHTYTLQAAAIDKNGFIYEFKFPKTQDFGVIEAVTRVRHSKFTSNVGPDDSGLYRELAARHVVRALKLPPEVFPVDVELQYLVRESPPPGSAPDPMQVTYVQPIRAYRYPTFEEAHP